jgi:ABC-type anion transport system duplicated permease subunit
MHQQRIKCRWLIGLEEVAGGWYVLFGCICGVKNASAEEYTQMAGNQHEGLRK